MLRVVDAVAPVLQCQQTISLYANGQCQATVPLMSQNVTDNCSSVNLTQSITSDSIIELGQTQINVTATDSYGNKVLSLFHSMYNNR